MNLIELGWNSFFSQNFEPYKEQAFVPARIAVEQKNHYLIYSEDGEMQAEVSGKILHQAQSNRDFPVVGDWVVIAPQANGATAIIHAILPRKSQFSRETAGVKTEEQVLVSNVDTIFLVSGLDRDFNLRRIERYLTLAWDSGASPVIVLNKADISPNLDEQLAEVQAIAFGVPIYLVSALKNQGLEQLRESLTKGQTVAMLGSSGVGKSSLINSLIGKNQQLVNSTRANDGRGRHTTTYRELIFLDSGGMIIDNPGMRELRLWVDEEQLHESFEDVQILAAECRFRDCKHEAEPGCAVREALEQGKLDAGRFQSYLKLVKELKYLKTRQDYRAQLDEKNKWKKIKMDYRKSNKKL